MVQEKQLKELFKYIEANWDVCVSQVDKTDIKRIFGGVLCEDIMNDTLHEVKAESEELKGNCSTFDMSRLVDQPQPTINAIEQAYERGDKIRRKYWQTNCWIKKHSRVHSIDEKNEVYKNYSIDFDFDDNPQNWEIYIEPQPEHTEQPSKPFDKDRFERMFRAVVASGRTESYEQDFLATNICLEKLDAYYASKEGGNEK